MAQQELPGIWESTYLGLPPDLEIEDWVEVVKATVQQDTTSRFWVGDAINFGWTTYGEEAAQVFSRVDYEEGTLRNYAYVARQIPASLRREGVYWSHYYELASVQDDVLRAELLDRSANGDLTTAEIKEIKRGDEQKEPEETELCPHCKGSGRVPVAKENLA